MLSLSANVTGDTTLKLKLDKIAAGARDLRPAFNEMEHVIVGELERNFDTRGSSFGNPWAMRKYSYAWPILQKTGKMKRAWKSTITSFSLKIDNATSYAKYHQYGTTRLPIRQVAGISRNMVQVIIRTIKKHLRKSIH